MILVKEANQDELNQLNKKDKTLWWLVKLNYK
jgi:hypothetical protein